MLEPLGRYLNVLSPRRQALDEAAQAGYQWARDIKLPVRWEVSC